MLMWVRCLLLMLVLPAGMGVATAGASSDGKTPNAAGIYSCQDANGRHITSDRPIPSCLDREQRVLNKDGSQRKVVPPRQTLQERLKAEEIARERERAEQAHLAAVRRDRKLMMRFPDEATHNLAREKALDDVREAMGRSELRVRTLQRERKGLMNEAEFYKKKTMPIKLKSEIEGNDASLAAQAEIIANHQAEMKRLNAVYDTELARLRLLWGGAPPGSLAAPSSPAP